MNDPVIRRRNLLAAALFASLLLNGLLAGVAIGHGIHFFDSPVEPQKDVTPAQGFQQNGFAGRIKELPAPEQHKFNAAMKPFRPAIRDARADLVAARQRLNETFMIEPYNPEAVRSALKDVREKTTNLQSLLQDGAADSLAGLTPESRRKLAGK